ncbi:MAG: DHH family phosphoesterase [Acetatifactor sp.]|nr:DHH family phosphoesterase [Acetatifactor sp.]
MLLSDLESYNPITIQCHDNPDADALGAGYGLYCYFQSRGKQVRLLYSGKNQIQKSNLRMLVEELKLPIEYVEPLDGKLPPVEGLLITVDCQYGAGNVTALQADAVAIIDHHQREIEDVPLSLIKPGLGSCCTLVWQMLTEAGYEINDEAGLGTALYYGLYTDTNQFSELYNPLDMDMREAVPYDKSLITLLRNSNLSLRELEVAGVAMIRYSFNDDYGFSVIKAQPCDPNILGIISDFLLQVDLIKTCVVFNEGNDGYKYSVRSCIKEVKASELAGYLAEGIGSGGGHYEKAGGFISMKLYEEKYPTLHAEGYFNNRMVEYFDSFKVLYAGEYQADTQGMELYEKKRIPVGYVEADKLLPVGAPITIRTQEGDLELTVEEDLYLLIGVTGQVSPLHRAEFEHIYQTLDERYTMKDYRAVAEYAPVVKNRDDGRSLVLTDYARKCVTTGQLRIYARPLEKGVKVFTLWDKNKYLLGRPGDYLAVRCDDMRDIFVVEREIFALNYDRLCPDEKNG